MNRGSALRCTVLLATVTVVLLAGCTSSGQPDNGGTTVPSTAPTTPPTVASTSTPASETSSPPTSSAASSTAPSSTGPATTGVLPPPPPPPPPPPQTTCKSVSVRVLPGGASFGEQVAGLEFTNSGPTTCVLAGYPTVTLLLNGHVIGRPSEPSSTAKSVRTLRPGGVAESLLHDYTQTCQAPLSDSLRVQVPGTRQTILRPGMQLRACVLRVDRLKAPD